MHVKLHRISISLLPNEDSQEEPQAFSRHKSTISSRESKGMNRALLDPLTTRQLVAGLP